MPCRFAFRLGPPRSLRLFPRDRDPLPETAISRLAGGNRVAAHSFLPEPAHIAGRDQIASSRIAVLLVRRAARHDLVEAARYFCLRRGSLPHNTAGQQPLFLEGRPHFWGKTRAQNFGKKLYVSQNRAAVGCSF